MGQRVLQTSQEKSLTRSIKWKATLKGPSLKLLLEIFHLWEILTWVGRPRELGRKKKSVFLPSGRSPGTMRPLASFLAFYHRAGRLEQWDHLRLRVSSHFIIRQVAWNNETTCEIKLQGSTKHTDKNKDNRQGRTQKIKKKQ